jgi:hypothetical protein
MKISYVFVLFPIHNIDFSAFSELMWEMIVHFVDIDGSFAITV